VFLIKALQDAGKGKWFRPVERVGLDNLIKERQLIRNQRETYEGKDAKPLSPMLISGVMIEGGIVGYDSNVTTGGVGAALLGIGLSSQYNMDVVTVVMRLISVHTGEVLVSSGATKTILSAGMGGTVTKFIDQGTMSLQLEAGATGNEPATYAVRLAVEAAVVDMIKQGATKGLWSYAKSERAKPKKNP
jgi:curli production assembly/transport component CsgG